MSGGQGGGCRFENALTLLMNSERPTTCRYHMPYVVAYVVGYVEGLVVYFGLAEASTRPRRGFWHSEQRPSEVMAWDAVNGPMAGPSILTRSGRSQV
jgi:hypothetical protein